MKGLRKGHASVKKAKDCSEIINDFEYNFRYNDIGMKSNLANDDKKVLFAAKINRAFEHSASFAGLELVKVRPIRKSYSTMLLKNIKYPFMQHKKGQSLEHNVINNSYDIKQAEGAVQNSAKPALAAIRKSNSHLKNEAPDKKRVLLNVMVIEESVKLSQRNCSALHLKTALEKRHNSFHIHRG